MNASENEKQLEEYGDLPTGPTGRQIIVLRPESQKSLITNLKDTAGLYAVSSSEFDDAVTTKSGDYDALILDQLNVAVVEGDPEQVQSLEAAVEDNANPVLSIEPELYVIPFNDDGSEILTEPLPYQALLTEAGREYIRGYAAATQAIAAQLLDGGDGLAGAESFISATFSDSDSLTWGLQAVQAARGCSGRGIRVAVLDTGFDLSHPDFAGRSIISTSFIPGVPSAQDGHSHGTHCIGTACGPKSPAGGVRRYGIAYESTILVGKVLADSGSGQMGGILAGMNWAIQNGAAIISMSLGSPVAAGQSYSPAYEQAALAALNKNCLVIAAAGNSGNNPVGSPANCPSVMAVAAVDSNLQRASFSCRGINPNGGEVNIAAPGVDVFSSVPMRTRYAFMKGTSMATPHVSGCAAQWAQWSGLRGKALWQKLTSTAQNIGGSPTDIGAGLVKSPVRLALKRPPERWRIPKYRIPPFPIPVKEPVLFE